MVQQGALLPSIIRFGPYWCSIKIMWAHIVHAVLDVGTLNVIKLLFLTWLVQLKI